VDGVMTTLENEDWLKSRTWDLYRGSELVTTTDNLLWALSVQDEPEDQQIAAIRHFMTLPAWLAAPAELVKSVAEFLA
jgi:hypothetical protein